MVKTKREYILATCFMSGAAAIISLVSLGTQNWVESDGKWNDVNLPELNKIKFGLFEGTFRQSVPYPATFQLIMTCLLNENICALLCGTDQTARYTQLKNLYNNEETSFDTVNCPRITSRVYSRALKAVNEKQFINSGVWVSTIFFLSISAVLGLLCSGLAVWNTASNPIEVYFSVYGLYIYNAISFFSLIIVLMVWGIMFAKTTIHNVAIYYTLVGDITSDGRAQLGYSYWINFASLFFYAGSIFVLYLRQYLISKEPEVNVHIEDNGDPGLYLY